MDNVWAFPKYVRDIYLKGFIRRCVVETMERYGVIPDTALDHTVGIQRLTTLHTFLNDNYPNTFRYRILDLEDGSKTLVILADTENKMIQLKTFLVDNKGLKWVTYFDSSGLGDGRYKWAMMLNSYEVTQ